MKAAVDTDRAVVSLRSDLARAMLELPAQDPSRMSGKEGIPNVRIVFA